MKLQSASLSLRPISAAVAARLMLVVGLSLSGSAIAQVSTVVFKNFHKYPATGLWSQELSGTRNGVSLGPPTTSKSCVGVTDPKTITMLQKMGDNNPASCKTSVITDTERLAEYERKCTVGGSPRVTHSTMKMVDDKTMTIDTLDETPGFIRTAMHSTVTYLGTCTAPSSKPSAADCAEIETGMREMADGEAQCAQAPGAYKAQCLAQIDSSRKTMEAIRTQCR